MKMNKLALMLALSLTLQSVNPMPVTAAEALEENTTQILSEAETETVLEERSEKEQTKKETLSDNEGGKTKEELTAEEEEIPKSVIPKGTSSRKYRNFFADKGRYYYIAEGIDGKNTEFMSGYKNIGIVSVEDLVVGDIILKESDGDINNGPDHTKIFLRYEDGIVEYVSSNANDSVMVSHCSVEAFHGVCRPDF